MLRKMLLAVSYVIVFVGMSEINSVLKASSKGIDKTISIHAIKAKKIVDDFDINVVSVDSQAMSDLGREIACGSHIQNEINMESLGFRETLATLALEKIDFKKENAAMKAALICFALQSTSYLSIRFWNKYKIDDLLFNNGRDDARRKCFSLYKLALEKCPYAFVPAHIWEYMYSKRLVDTRFSQ
jgi:hypothetical protein